VAEKAAFHGEDCCGVSLGDVAMAEGAVDAFDVDVGGVGEGDGLLGGAGESEDLNRGGEPGAEEEDSHQDDDGGGEKSTQGDGDDEHPGGDELGDHCPHSVVSTEGLREL